jgi:hypothetical protein
MQWYQYPSPQSHRPYVLMLHHLLPSNTATIRRRAKQVQQARLWGIWRAIHAVIMEHPHVADTVQFFKKICRGTTMALLERTKRWEIHQGAEALDFPSIRGSS